MDGDSYREPSLKTKTRLSGIHDRIYFLHPPNNLMNLMNLTFDEELKALIRLIQFKQFQRYGQTLFAKYPVPTGGQALKPEITLSELAWGFCRNPCYATRLASELERLVVNCEQFSATLAKANRLIENSKLVSTFDQAMRRVCMKTKDRETLVYSLESTNQRDRMELLADGTYAQTLYATDEDGELWHGLRIADHADWNKIDSIQVRINAASTEETLWQRTYTRDNVVKHTKTLKDTTMFMPFSHPMVLLNLDVALEIRVNYERAPTDELDQVFGIGSDEFCTWLSTNAFEIKLVNGDCALVDLAAKTINFRV